MGVMLSDVMGCGMYHVHDGLSACLCSVCVCVYDMRSVCMCECEVRAFACGFSVAVIASCAPVRPRERRKDEDR